MERQPGLDGHEQANYNLVKLLSHMFTNSQNPNLPRVHLPGDGVALNNHHPPSFPLPPQYFSMMKFSGYNDEISAVVAKTFDKSPRTADSVRTMLTPRYLPQQQDFPTSSYYTNSGTFNSDQSTWPRFTSSAPEVTFSDLSLNFSQTPRPSKSDRAFTLTPRTSRSESRYGVEMQHQHGSPFSQEELRHYKLNQRPLPTPHSSRPGRDENGVHIPYLDLPITSRSNTLVNYNDLFFNSLLTSYQSSTGALTKGPDELKGGPFGKEGGGHKGKNVSGETQADNGEKGGGGGGGGGGWSKKEKMFLLALICVALVVLLLVIVVVLLAIGVGSQGDDKETTINLIGNSGNGDTSGSSSSNNNNTSFAPDPGLSSATTTSSLTPMLTTYNHHAATSAVSKPTTTTTTISIIRPAQTSASSPSTTSKSITKTTTKSPSVAKSSQPPTTINIVDGGNSARAPTTTTTTTISGGGGGGGGGSVIRVTTPATSSSTTVKVTTPPASTTTNSGSANDGIIVLPIPETQTTPKTTKAPATTTTTTTTTTTEELIIADKTLGTIATTPTTKLSTTLTTTTTTPPTTTTTTTTTTTPTTTTTTTTTTEPTTTTPTEPPTTESTEDPLAQLAGERCQTPRCQELAQLLVANQNTSALPCKEFHEYSCGSDDQSTTSHFTGSLTSLQHLITEDLYELVADALANVGNGRTSGTLYRACLSSNQDEDVVTAFTEAKAILNDLGLTSTLTSTISFDLVLRRLQDGFGLGTFFSLQKVPEFDGFQYNYVFRATPPSPMFPPQEYSLYTYDQSPAAQSHIQTLATILEAMTDEEGTGRKKKKRRRKRSSNHEEKGTDNSTTTEEIKKDLSGNPWVEHSRYKRQSPGGRATIERLLDNVFKLEWALAGILPDDSIPTRELLVESLSVRTLQSQAPAIPWSFLTELTVIDNIQVQYIQYFRELNTVLAQYADVITLYGYVKLLVEMLPYMPSGVRRDLNYNATGIKQIYSNEDCSRIALHLLPNDVMAVLSEGQSLRSEEQWALAVMENAKSDVQRVVGSFQGIGPGIKNDVLNDLSSLQVRLAYSSSQDDDVTLDDASPSFLSAATEIKGKQTAILFSTSQGSSNERPLSYYDLDPVVQVEEGAIELSVSLVHLGAWLADAEFLWPFYKSLMYRSLMEYVMKRHMYSQSFNQLQRCWISEFPFLASYQDTRAEIAILVEAATMELLLENRFVRTTSVVQMGESYFYERHLLYMAYAQRLCTPGVSSHAMTMWRGSIKNKDFLDTMFGKHYQGTRSFECTQPSCFFWSQSLFGEGQ